MKPAAATTEPKAATCGTHTTHTKETAMTAAAEYLAHLEDLCDAACERKPGQGPVERMRELLQDVMRRHPDDDVTRSALLAIDAYHLADVEELLQEVA